MSNLIRYILICTTAALSAIVVAAPTINLQSDKTSYTVGDTVILVISLSDAPLIYGGGLDLAFNPVVLNALSVQVDPSWDFTIKEGIIDNAAGDISDIFFTHFSGLTGNLPVATITLDTIAAGSTGLSIAVSTVKQFTDTGGEIVVFGTSNLASNVLVNTATPEESETEETTADQTDTNQSTTEQSETQQNTSNNSGFVPTNRPLSHKEHSDTDDNNSQNGNSIVTSKPPATSTLQRYTKISPYNNGASSPSNELKTDLEYADDNQKEKSIESSSQSAINASNKKPDNIPTLLVILIFIVLAFMVYKITAYYKK